ncbi:hypothetical protein [Devosia chinhatensis]|uniref:hypothetical protein n=1 Tax=Devosia chinhatensis TaxID=429727 RepID=UPI00069763BE|nr:hypothetical protein [Devosia chinhatensis]
MKSDTDTAITGERLRADIDAGLTGDKIAFPDPAAAPLETDAEAGGNATSFRSERRQPAANPKGNWAGMLIYVGLAALIASVAASIVWLGTAA